MPSKKSGGARAVEKKHRERTAARKRGGTNAVEAWARDFTRLVGPAPRNDAEAGFAWLANAALFAAERALTDAAIPLEQRIDRFARLLTPANKVLDPARLAAKLQEFASVVSEQRAATETTIDQTGHRRAFIDA